MTEISDVNVYFERLYSESINPPPITVDEFLDIMAKCKDSVIPKEKVKKRIRKSRIHFFFFKEVFQNGIEKLFKQYKYYSKYPKRELILTAQLFGGLIERSLFPNEVLTTAFQIILEGLKKPMGNYLWNFAIAALDRCKAR